jgi:hypothetical protein
MQYIQDYTVDLYEYINEYLRLGLEYNDLYEDYIRNIDKVLIGSTEKRVVFRGLPTTPIFGVELG